MRWTSHIPLLMLLAVYPAAAIEVSTGFLIGPKYDPRAIYVRGGAGEAWQKMQAGGYRKAAEGKLLGVRRFVEGSTPDTAGATMIRVPLQSETENAFTLMGEIAPQARKELSALLKAAQRRRLVVELAVFHPAKDQELYSPDHLLDAVRNVVDWLIEGDHRNVILNFAPDWEVSGWDFNHWVPTQLGAMVDTARARFQQKHADFASPIAISVSHRAGESSKLIESADVVELMGDALEMDPRKIERPSLAVGREACVVSFDRMAGCVVEGPEAPGPLLRLFYSKPPSAAVGQ